MGWESEFQESLPFKSEVAVTQALEMDLHSSGLAAASQPCSWTSAAQHESSLGSEEEHRNWDSLLKASNVAASTRFQSDAFAAAGFPRSSGDEAGRGRGSNPAGSILVGSSSPPPAVVLNAHGSAGAASTKVSKKRSRASRRPPTTVLEADSANFRSMVQQLTGIPAPPSILSSSIRPGRFDFFGGGAAAPSSLVRPQPTRSSIYHPGLSALDATSFHYQPPYSLRRLEGFGGAARGSSSHASFMDQVSPAAAGGIYSTMQGAPGIISVTRPSSSAMTPQLVEGVYVAHSGSSTTSPPGLAMPSLWECEARQGESLNARIKGEVAAEEARRSSGGRPIASWSSGSF